MNILEEIAGKTRERIGQEKGKVSVAELKERIRAGNRIRRFFRHRLFIRH